MSQIERPNIILIMTDHFRPDALGPGTPNLLKLAKRGTHFDNAYAAAPLCQPSRVALATGLYPSQNGVCGNMATPVDDALRDDTFMNHLQRAGYYTALVGKHHFIDRYGIGMDVIQDDAEVRRYGFDFVWQVVDCGENMHNDDRYTHWLAESGRLAEYRRIQGERAWACGQYPFPEEDCEDAYIGRIAGQFLAQYDRDQPFYLNVSFVGPHPPYWHPGELQHDPAAMRLPLGAADSQFVRERRAHYMDKCSIIDQAIGKLLDTLAARGLADDTVIIFTSDHGDNLGDFGIWDKRFFYEQSVGVPMIMAGPGIRSGARGLGGYRCKALVSLLDLYPTILALAGVDTTGLMRRRDGRNLLPILADQRGAFREELFAELGTAAMVRTGNWKLVFDPEQGGVQYLFSLANDPGEEHNLAGVAGYEHVTLDLLQRLLAHRIRLTQYTHDKEEQRVQRVRIGR